MKRQPGKPNPFEGSRSSGNGDYYRQIWRLVSDNRRWFPAVFGLLFYFYASYASDAIDDAAGIGGEQAEESRPKNPWALDK